MGRKPKENPARELIRYSYEVRDVIKTPTALRGGEDEKYTTGHTFKGLLFQDCVHSLSAAFVKDVSEKDPARANRIHDHLAEGVPLSSFSKPQRQQLDKDGSLMLKMLKENMSPEDFVMESSTEDAQRESELLDEATPLPYGVKVYGKEG